MPDLNLSVPQQPSRAQDRMFVAPFYNRQGEKKG